MIPGATAAAAPAWQRYPHTPVCACVCVRFRILAAQAFLSLSTPLSHALRLGWEDTTTQEGPVGVGPTSPSPFSQALRGGGIRLKMICCSWTDPSVTGRERCDSDVFLNVYDITSLNAVLGLVGMGAHHSGVEVFMREYCFGRAVSDTGVHSIPPKSCEGHTFRESIYLGRTTLSRSEVHALIRELQKTYTSDMYHVVRWNCNHFAEELCNRLLGVPRIAHYPAWVNRPCRSALTVFPGNLVERIDQADYEMFVSRLEVPEGDGDGDDSEDVLLEPHQ